MALGRGGEGTDPNGWEAQNAGTIGGCSEGRAEHPFPIGRHFGYSLVPLRVPGYHERIRRSSQQRRPFKDRVRAWP